MLLHYSHLLHRRCLLGLTSLILLTRLMVMKLLENSGLILLTKKASDKKEKGIEECWLF